MARDGGKPSTFREILVQRCSIVRHKYAYCALAARLWEPQVFPVQGVASDGVQCYCSDCTDATFSHAYSDYGKRSWMKATISTGVAIWQNSGINVAEGQAKTTELLKYCVMDPFGIPTACGVSNNGTSRSPPFPSMVRVQYVNAVLLYESL
jgi:hypothetical protein